MKRIVSLAFLVVMAGAFLASAAFADKKTVTIWNYWENQIQQETLAKVCADFNGSQSPFQVVTKYIPFADFKKQLSIGAAAAASRHRGARQSRPRLLFRDGDLRRHHRQARRWPDSSSISRVR